MPRKKIACTNGQNVSAATSVNGPHVPSSVMVPPAASAATNIPRTREILAPSFRSSALPPTSKPHQVARQKLSNPEAHSVAAGPQGKARRRQRERTYRRQVAGLPERDAVAAVVRHENTAAVEGRPERRSKAVAGQRCDHGTGGSANDGQGARAGVRDPDIHAVEYRVRRRVADRDRLKDRPGGVELEERYAVAVGDPNVPAVVQHSLEPLESGRDRRHRPWDRGPGRYDRYGSRILVRRPDPRAVERDRDRFATEKIVDQGHPEVGR